ncbi:MAG: GLUG motif-containing protein, partial [archaeon]
MKFNYRAQGTIEYLIIIAIVVVIALVVVSILTGFLSTGSETDSQSKQISALVGEFSVSELAVTTDGNFVLNIKNNDSTVTITDVELIDKNNQDFTYSLPQSGSQNFVVYSNETCEEGDKQSATIKISYMTKHGLNKTYWLQDIPFDCVNYSVTNTANSSTTTISTGETLVLSDTDCFDDALVGGKHPICTCLDLDNIDKNTTTITWDFVQLYDIDFAECDSSYTTGVGWEPLADATNYYRGNFDGNNKIIKNLFINDLTQTYAGLFENIQNAQLDDITLIDVNVIGNQYVGGIVGSNLDSNITNSDVNGVIFGASSYVGGITGRNYRGKIIDCNNYAQITGLGYEIG